MNNLAPKILIVDDERDLELLINQKFRKEIKSGQYHFLFAYNGVEALNKLNENKEIELVLTDINMPKMDGLTLLLKIKELNNPLLHSVIVSAKGDILNIRTAMNAGAFDFVVKPINLSDLEITIKKAFDNLITLKKALQSRDELIAVRKELEEAKALQLSMLPKTLPKTTQFDFAVYMNTASEVGGDYYDFIQKEDGSINVAIGDATGHGMRAGIMVAIMKTLLVSDKSALNIVDFFNLANKTIKTLNLGRMLMAFAMLNINNKKIQFVSAGMPPFYIFRKRLNLVEEVMTNGMPFGAVNDFPYESREIEISSGDTLLLLSDGFPELQNASNEQYGYSRLKETFKSVAEKDPEEIIYHLKNEGNLWSDNKEPDDDVSFVVIKVK
jgi:sigma-B regulation protein RsbU (phosphoserine phosphatase)